MSILQILQIVVLVLDIIFFVFLGINLLCGFLKGWRKSTLNLLAFLIPFLLIMCFRGLISETLLNISFPEIGTLKEFITNEVVNSLYSEGAVTTELYNLCESVAKTIINLAVYIVGIIVAYILSFIFRIIFALTLKPFIYAVTGGKKEAPSMTCRLFGLIPGFAHFLTALILIFFPLAGVVNVFNMTLEDTAIVEGMISNFTPSEDEQKMSSMDDMFEEIQVGLDDSVTMKIINLGKNKNTGVSLAGNYLGSLLKIKTDNAKVNIVKEYGRVRQVLPVLNKILNESINENIISLENITENDIRKITDIFEKTEIIKLFAPVAQEFLLNEMAKDVENAELVEKIKQINIINEITVMTEIFVEVINTSSELEINLDAPQDIILTPTLSTHISAIMESIFKSDIVNYILLPEVEKLVKESLPEEYSDLALLLTAENIKTCLKTDVARLLVIYQNLAKYNNLHNFIFNESELIFDTEDSLNNIENSIINLFNISIIRGHEEELIKTGLNLASIDGLTYESLFNGLNPDWKNEVSVLAKTFKSAIEVANTLDLFNNFDNIGIETFVAKNENGEYVLEELLNQITESKVFRNVILNYLESMEFEGDIKEIIDIIDLEKIRLLESTDFNNEFKRLLEILDILVQMNLFNDEDIKLDKNNIKTLINNAFDSIFIKGKEDQLIKFALSKASVEGLSYESLIGDFTPNWQIEKDVFANTLYDLLELLEEHNIKEDFSLELLVKKDENDKYIFENIIVDISKSELLKNIIVNYISSIELDAEAKEILDLLNIGIIKDLSENEFKNEFIRFLDILDVAVNMNLIGEGEVILNSDSISSLINTIFDSIFIKGNEQKIIEYILKATELNATLEENGINLKYEDIDWTIEKQNLINLFNSILALGDIESFDFNTILNDRTDETNDKIINLISALGESQIFGDAIFDILENTVKEVGYEITFTNDDKTKILENTWKKEAECLLDLIDFCTEKLGDSENYNTISGTEIQDIMTKASETVIATKVLGTVLNEMLGKEYLGINPILEDGTYKYDFTNQATLLDTAKDIGALVDLKNKAQDLDMSDITKATESVDTIIESIKILDESGLAKDMIQEVIGEDSGVNLDEINLSNEAETIQKVYDVYKEDHENFDINEHPELKEELEESDFAKTILGMLGITL